MKTYDVQPMSPLCGAFLKIVLFLVQIWIKALKKKKSDASTFFALLAFSPVHKYVISYVAPHSLWNG